MQKAAVMKSCWQPEDFIQGCGICSKAWKAMERDRASEFVPMHIVPLIKMLLKQQNER